MRLPRLLGLAAITSSVLVGAACQPPAPPTPEPQVVTTISGVSRSHNDATATSYGLSDAHTSGERDAYASIVKSPAGQPTEWIVSLNVSYSANAAGPITPIQPGTYQLGTSAGTRTIAEVPNPTSPLGRCLATQGNVVVSEIVGAGYELDRLVANFDVVCPDGSRATAKVRYTG